MFKRLFSFLLLTAVLTTVTEDYTFAGEKFEDKKILMHTEKHEVEDNYIYLDDLNNSEEDIYELNSAVDTDTELHGNESVKVIEKINLIDENYEKIPRDITDILVPYITITERERQLTPYIINPNDNTILSKEVSIEDDIAIALSESFGSKFFANEILVENGENYISYLLLKNGIKLRYIYYNDGRITKQISCERNGEVYLIKNSDNLELTKSNSFENRVTLSLTEGEVEEFQQDISLGLVPYQEIYPIEYILEYLSQKKIVSYPNASLIKLYDQTSTQQKNVNVFQPIESSEQKSISAEYRGTWSSTIAGSSAYTKNDTDRIDIRIYDSRKYYIEKEKTFNIFEAGKTVLEISDLLSIGRDLLRGVLRAADVLGTTLDVLTWEVELTSFKTYIVGFYREATTYDKTYNMGEVELPEMYCQAEIGISYKGYDELGRKINPQWGLKSEITWYPSGENHQAYADYVADVYYRHCRINGHWTMGANAYGGLGDGDVMLPEHQHTYSSSCDSLCNMCSYNRNSSSTHSFTTKYNLEKHWEQCSLCSAIGSEGYHTFSGYGTHMDGKCNWVTCEFKHSHTPVSQWTSSEYSHNKKCTDSRCNTTFYYGNHDFTNSCDTSCDTCGKTRSITHTYSGVCDTICNVCGATRTASAHSYTNSCDTACNSCGMIRSIVHSYSGICDTSCNICGATRTASDHSYTNSCDTSCNVCGAARTVSAHSYTNSCDTSCNVCGAIRAISHSYSGVCDRTCNVCGATRTASTHSYSNSCDTSCNVCGDTRTISHTYSNACDKSCNVCGVTRTISHSYSGACDSSCNICGATRTASSHSYTNSCDTSCNVCGTTRTIVHAYSGACDSSCNVCGSTRTASTHSYTSYSNNGSSGHTVRCSVCGVSGGTSSHSKSSHDGGHSGKIHYYVDRCSKCSYSYTWSRSCSGPPCVVPYSIPQEIE